MDLSGKPKAKLSRVQLNCISITNVAVEVDLVFLSLENGGRLFCFVLLCLFCFVSFCVVSIWFVCLALFCFVLFCSVLFFA